MKLQTRARIHAALGDEHRLEMVESLGLSDRTTKELAAITGLPGNLLAHHLNVLEENGLVERRVSEGDKRRRYIVLRHEPLRHLLTPANVRAQNVLFVCTHNSARSQFAAALWKQKTGDVAQSAGQEPAASVHPNAVKAASELGVDLNDATPRAYHQIVGSPDLVISVCDRAREGKLNVQAPRIHWSIPDPVRIGNLAAFRQSFASISERIDRATTPNQEFT